MESIEEKIARILAIEDPHEAYIEAGTDPELPMDIAEQIINKYMEMHKVDLYEMAYYPNGERALTLEVYQERMARRKQRRKED